MFGTNALSDGDGRGRFPGAFGVLRAFIVLLGSLVFLVMSQVGS